MVLDCTGSEVEVPDYSCRTGPGITAVTTAAAGSFVAGSFAATSSLLAGEVRDS